jgi:hypothetical protein
MTARGALNKRSHSGWEFTVLFGFIFLLMIVWYGVSSYLVEPLADPNNIDKAQLLPSIFGFGFNQLRWLPAWVAGLWLVITVSVMWAVYRYPQKIITILHRAAEILYARKIRLVFLSLFFAVTAFLLRSQLINDDTLHFMNWMPHQAAHSITHVRFDEMLESNLHFEVYRLAHWLWGWDVQYTYSVLSCLAGFFFLYVLLLLCRRLAGNLALGLFAFIVSGGFMQLFFGDKENYTLAMTLLLIYFFFSHKYLTKEAPLTTPAFFLALAMVFHLEAAYLLPTLFFLTIVELNRREYLTACAAWVLAASLFSLTMLYFIFRGAEWQSLRDTSWGLGRGGNILFNIVFPEGLLVFARLNMMALIFPSIIFLLPAVLAGGFRPDRMSVFYLIAAVPGLFFAWVWISTIGYYSDWNLFSMPMFSAVVLLGICLFRMRPFPFRNSILAGMTMVSFLASYTWIIHNHYLFPW